MKNIKNGKNDDVLDTESRCIFILGTMIKVDNRITGDISALLRQPADSDFQESAPKWRIS